MSQTGEADLMPTSNEEIFLEKMERYTHSMNGVPVDRVSIPVADLLRLIRMAAAGWDAETQQAQHPDDEAIDHFAAAMRDKMRRSREQKGRGGWQAAPSARLTYLLVEHLEKGDPVDVANFAMMLHQNGQRLDELVVYAYRKAVGNKVITCRQDVEGEQVSEKSAINIIADEWPLS